MLQKSHRVIGVIRIEPPTMDIPGGEDDDSTIGGMLARFAQRSLLIGDSRESRWSPVFARKRFSKVAATVQVVHANLRQLTEDLEDEFAALSDVIA